MSIQNAKYCREHWSSGLFRKLGSCRYCMRLVALVTFLAWLAGSVVYVLDINGLVMGLALVVAGSLTGLLLAHVTAFFIRSARIWRAARPVDPALTARGHVKSRRGFFVTAATALAAVFLPRFLRPSPALAHIDPCIGVCRFTATVIFHQALGGRFTLLVDEGTAGGGCVADVGFARGGSLEFQVHGQAPCTIRTIEQFQNSPTNCPGTRVVGLGFLEHQAPEGQRFDFIRLQGVHLVSCNPNDADCTPPDQTATGTCKGENNEERFRFRFEATFNEQQNRYDIRTNGRLSTVADTMTLVTWVKRLDCMASCG